MSYIILTAGSVTSAVRLEKKLNANGIFNTSVIHTPTMINSGGCSYSVRLSYDSFNYIKNLLAEKKIKVRGIYIQESKNGERVYSVIS